jgi:hypothetical protein
MPKQPTRNSVTVELEGKIYSGTYHVSSKVVTIQCAYGSTSTQVGGSTAVAVARILLREILRGAKARREL